MPASELSAGRWLKQSSPKTPDLGIARYGFNTSAICSTTLGVARFFDR